MTMLTAHPIPISQTDARQIIENYWRLRIMHLDTRSIWHPIAVARCRHFWSEDLKIVDLQWEREQKR
jgi:hypothetical protein